MQCLLWVFASCAYVHHMQDGCNQRSEGTGSSGTGVQVFVSSLWLLGIEPTSSARAAVLSAAEPSLQPQVTYLSYNTLSPKMELFIEMVLLLILASQDWDKANLNSTFIVYSSCLSLLYTLSCDFNVYFNVFLLFLLICYLISIENSAIATVSKDDFGDIWASFLHLKSVNVETPGIKVESGLPQSGRSILQKLRQGVMKQGAMLGHGSSSGIHQKEIGRIQWQWPWKKGTDSSKTQCRGRAESLATPSTEGSEAE